METVTTVTTFADAIKSIDFGAVSDNILLAITATAGVVVGIIAIKKGYAFLKRQVKGA